MFPLPAKAGSLHITKFMNNNLNATEMGVVRRWLWYYTHKLGLEFSLVLFLSLIYQLFVASFIALKGMVYLPIVGSLYCGDWLAKLAGFSLGLIIAALIQGLLIAEMAQVVWLRYPEKLNIRLLSKSAWWKIMVGALVVFAVLDLVLLFLATTEQSSVLGAVYYVLGINQFAGIMVVLLSVLNFLTILRCASVMRTSTTEQTGRNLQEYLLGIAQDTLITASETVHSKTALLWQTLGVSPDRLIPLHNSIIDFIASAEGDKLPGKLPGGAWAWDWRGNRLVKMPPDVHAALVQNSEQFTRPELPGSGDAKTMPNESDALWKLGPEHLAALVQSNMASKGRPDVVDATDPASPKYIPNPPLPLTKATNPATTNQAPTAFAPANSPQPKANTIKKPNSKNTAIWLNKLTASEQQEFGRYLAELYGLESESDQPEAIFNEFEADELAALYAQWQAEVDPWQGEPPDE